MKDVPAPLVGFARIGLVLALALALWKPAEDFTPGSIDANHSIGGTVELQAGLDTLAQRDADESLLTSFSNAVGLDDALDSDSSEAASTLVR